MRKLSFHILVLALITTIGCATQQPVIKSADAYLYRGLAYAKKGQHDKAISDFNKALEINPKYAEAYFNRGITWIKKFDFDQAIADFNKAIEINPRYDRAYHDRATVWVLKFDFDRAIADCNKAIEINSRYAKAYILRGLTYDTLGKKKKGCSDLKHACELGDCMFYKLSKTLGDCD